MRQLVHAVAALLLIVIALSGKRDCLNTIKCNLIEAHEA